MRSTPSTILKENCAPPPSDDEIDVSADFSRPTGIFVNSTQASDNMTLSPPSYARRPDHVALWFAPSEPPSELGEKLKSLGIRLDWASDAAAFARALGAGDDVDVVVPFARMSDIEEFAKMAQRILMPEDRDLGIIYVTTGSTPEDWTTPPDPRPFGVSHRIVPHFRGSAWSDTVETLKKWGTEPRRSAGRDRRAVTVTPVGGLAIEDWHARLLRAAFRGCREVKVSRVAQGYSGSLLMRADAVEGDGSDLAPMMAKAFPDSKAALEIIHFQSSVRPKLDEADFSEPESLRLISGEGRSMLVSRMVAGPNGEIVTFRSLFESRTDAVPSIIDQLTVSLRRLFQGAQSVDHSIAKTYLDRVSLSARQTEALVAELRLLRWPGIADSEDPLRAFVTWLDASAGKATKRGLIHGDLHGDNIVIRDEGKLRPVLIDFAHTELAHAVADLAALAADILVRVVPKTDAQNQHVASVAALLGKRTADTAPDMAIVRLRDAASKCISCETQEFAGAMLCRVLWIIPRVRDSGDRESLRASADALYRGLSGLL